MRRGVVVMRSYTLEYLCHHKSRDILHEEITSRHKYGRYRPRLEPRARVEHTPAALEVSWRGKTCLFDNSQIQKRIFGSTYTGEISQRVEKDIEAKIALRAGTPHGGERKGRR